MIIKKERRNDFRKAATIFLAAMLLIITACGNQEGFNQAAPKETEKRVVTLYSPMEKTNPGTENVARSASDKTIVMAEERLGVSVDYQPYRLFCRYAALIAVEYLILADF